MQAPSDEELLRLQGEARERAARAGLTELFVPPAQIATTLHDDLQLVAAANRRAAEYLGDDGTWEPQCVQCKNAIGYTCEAGRYRGRTLCDACLGDSMSERLEASGISFREIGQPLETLGSNDPDGKPYGGDYDRWLAFIRRFAALKPGERMKPPFAFVYGSNGVGKSAGAERALRDAIRNGCVGRAITFRELVRLITSTYGVASKDIDERADSIVRLFAGIHLLVIDEVGMEDPTDHAYGLFFDFVNGRWRNELPTIFNSNYSPDAESLGAKMTERTSDETKMRAILDRIRGGVGENVFLLRGKSWRGREAA